MNPFRLLPLVAATFPKGTALSAAAKFPATTKGVPLGELASAARLRGYFSRKKAPGAGCSSGRGSNITRCSCFYISFETSIVITMAM